MRKVRKGASPEEIRDQKKYDAGIRGGEDYTIFDELSDRDKANIEKVLAGEMSIELVPDEFRRHIIIKQYIEKVLAGEMSIERVPDDFRIPVNREVVLARADLKIQNRQQETNEGAKMSITRSMIRNIVNETMASLFEVDSAEQSAADKAKEEAEAIADKAKKEAEAKEVTSAVAIAKAAVAAEKAASLRAKNISVAPLAANIAESQRKLLHKAILKEMRNQGIF